MMKMSFKNRDASARHNTACVGIGCINAFFSSAGDREKITVQARNIKNSFQITWLPLIIEQSFNGNVADASSVDRNGGDSLNRPMESRKFFKIKKPLTMPCKMAGDSAVDVPGVRENVGESGHESDKILCCRDVGGCERSSGRRAGGKRARGLLPKSLTFVLSKVRTLSFPMSSSSAGMARGAFLKVVIIFLTKLALLRGEGHALLSGLTEIGGLGREGRVKRE